MTPESDSDPAPGPVDAGAPPGPDLRTSGLGLLSIACALLSVAACVVITLLSAIGFSSILVGLFALPALGLAAVVLGGLSLRRRAAPDGAIYTRGPAAGGVIVGLASVVLQGSFLVGAVRSFTPIRTQVVPVVASMAQEIEKGRPARARDALGDGVKGAVADQRIEGFFQRIETHCGSPMEVRFDLGALVRTRAALASAASPGADVSMDDFNPKPVEFHGPKGSVPVWVLLDERALSNDEVRIIDMMAIFGREADVLMPDGRFAQFARKAGVEVIPWADERPALPSSPDGR